MLMKVTVTDNRAEEVLKASGMVLERRLQDVKMSPERISRGIMIGGRIIMLPS
jgi:hypothetical protein